jgi:hypothetical protein
MHLRGPTFFHTTQPYVSRANRKWRTKKLHINQMSKIVHVLNVSVI